MTTYMQEELEACMEEKPLNTNVKVCYDRTSHPEMLTEKEMQSVTTVFRSFESGLRGATIDPSDLHKALIMLGLNPTEQEMVDIPNQIARNGLIYFPDFCQLCLEKFRESEEEQEEFYKIAFKLFCGTEPFPTDFRAKKYKINKHHITREDFCQLMKSLPVPVSDDDIEEMFNFADKNKDDKLSYKEFEVMLKPQIPPEVSRPHITDIGMLPQLFSPPATSKQESQSNFASPILPASKGTFSSRSSLASYKQGSEKSVTAKIGSVTSSSTNIANL